MREQFGTTIETGFKDRRTGLMVFGIIQIIIGAFCALAVPFMFLAMVSASAMAIKTGATPMNKSGIFFGVMFYALLAAFFITNGIGSIRARRWARALMLVFSWMWLVVGIFAIFVMMFLVPHTLAKLPGGNAMPGGMEVLVLVITLAFMSVIYVVLPAVFVFFYRSPHVKATCERFDPVPRWTDRCPLPVLALSLCFGYGACCMPAMGLYNWAFPFFGVILTGPVAAALVLASTVLWAWLAWGLYRLRLAAWWTAFAALLLWGTSACITFGSGRLMEFYEKMNFPPEQLEQMRKFMPSESIMLAMMLVSMLAYLGYLAFTKRFFPPARAA